MKAQLVKTPRYAGGGITSLMPKLQKSQKGKKSLRYADGGTTSTQYVSNVPPGGEAAYARLIGSVENLTDPTNPANKPPAYAGERLAQFTPMQRQGFEGVAGLGPDAGTMAAGTAAQQATQKALGTSYTPNTGFTAGAGPQQVGSQNFTQPGVAQQYMNPYMQNVVDIQKREATRADDIARTARNAQAVGQGAFGGSRQAIVEAEAGRNLAQQQNDIQAQGLNQSFQQAQQQFNADQTRGLQGQMANQNAGLQYGNQNLEAQRLSEASRQYGSTLGLQGTQAAIQGATAAGGIGNTLFNQGLTSAKTQVDAGGLQQANVQQGLDQAYGQYREDINFPYQQAGFLSDILRGSQGSSRSMYDKPAAPSTLQTLAGLAPIIGGLSGKNSITGARGGEVKSDAIGRGLARIAPDSVGNFASGGIIGYAKGDAIDPQAAEDREMFGRWWETAQDAAERSGAAIADVGTLVPRGLTGAYDTAVVRPMRAAGLPAEYLSGYLLPEDGDPRSMTPYYDRIRARDPQEPAKAKAPEKAKEVPGIDAGTITKKPPPVAAGGPAGVAGAERVTAPVIAAPGGVGGGGRAQTLAEMKAAQKAAGVDYDALEKAGLAGINRAGEIDKKAAEEDVTGLAALHDKMGQASLKREERLKEQGSTLAGDSLIRTGLAILTADPKRGWLGAAAAGATVGFAEYTARKEKLDSSLEALLEAREQADFAKGKDMMVAKRAVRTAERDWEREKTQFGNAIGLKKTEAAATLFNSYEQQVEGAKNRANSAGIAAAQMANQVAIHNASNQLTAEQGNANRAAQLELYGPGGKGRAGAGAKVAMTQDQYNDNVRMEADALMKATFDENGVPYTRAAATAEAKRIVDARRAGTPSVPSTAGWSKPTTTD